MIMIWIIAIITKSNLTNPTIGQLNIRTKCNFVFFTILFTMCFKNANLEARNTGSHVSVVIILT